MKEVLNMSKSISNVSFRIDTDLKNEANALFESLGMTLTTAFNIFLRQAVREKGMPFSVTTVVPNKQTLKAIEETREIMNNPNSKGYSLEEALKELKK